jgi:uncharacterized protein
VTTPTRPRSPDHDPSGDDTDPHGLRVADSTATGGPTQTAHTAPRVPGRRPMAAGNVVIVLVIAAIVGSLLNAAGIRKTANGQPVGVRRDAARLFAEPLYDLSHVLQIDELRKSIQSIAGRTGDDDINASLPDPITPDSSEGTPVSTTVPPKKEAFTPSKRLKVWVGGDSLSITPGESFVNLAPGTEVMDVANNFVDGHVATGLARPEVFNWPDHMLDVIAQDQPEALVITLGSNDDQSLTGEGGVGPYGSPEWMTEYRRRVGGMMDALTANSDRVLFWVGVPVLRVRSEDRYNPINQIYREEAQKRAGRVVYIDLDTPFRAPDGGYADYINGVQVRTPDGTHFSRAGGDEVAQMVIDAMNRTYDLQSWRPKATTPPTTDTPGTGAGTTPTTKKK